MYPLHTLVVCVLVAFAFGGLVGAASIAHLWLQARRDPTPDCPRCDGNAGKYKGRSRTREFKGYCTRCTNTGRVQRFGAGRYLRLEPEPHDAGGPFEAREQVHEAVHAAYVRRCLGHQHR
jgi:hypothetical protein